MKKITSIIVVIIILVAAYFVVNQKAPREIQRTENGRQTADQTENSPVNQENTKQQAVVIEKSPGDFELDISGLNRDFEDVEQMTGELNSATYESDLSNVE